MSSQQGGGGGFVAGFLFGGLVGAALAMLLTPRTGDETRDSLLEGSIELRTKAEDVVVKAREEADDLLVRGKIILEQQKTRVQEAIEEGKEAAAQKKAELISKYQVAKEKGEVPLPEEGTQPGPEQSPAS